MELGAQHVLGKSLFLPIMRNSWMKSARLSMVRDYQHISHVIPKCDFNVLKITNGIQLHLASRAELGAQHVQEFLVIWLITRHSWMKSVKVKVEKDYQHIAQLQLKCDFNVLKITNGM